MHETEEIFVGYKQRMLDRKLAIFTNIHYVISKILVHLPLLFQSEKTNNYNIISIASNNCKLNSILNYHKSMMIPCLRIELILVLHIVLITKCNLNTCIFSILVIVQTIYNRNIAEI